MAYQFTPSSQRISKKLLLLLGATLCYFIGGCYKVVCKATRQPLPAILKTTHQAMSVLPSFQSFQIKDIVICIGASAAWCVRP
jgi:hypothetical protein